jgi:hypothetical protein
MNRRLPNGLHEVTVDGEVHVVTTQQLGEIQAILSEPDKTDPDRGTLLRYEEKHAEEA